MSAVFVLATVAALCGLLLGMAGKRWRLAGNPVVDRIDTLLPQTQCAQCGYPGCRPYARALAAGQADINQCPPGGETVIHALADLLDRAPATLDPAYGLTKPRQVAVVREEDCIGCTLCIEACPVDAIVGSAKHLHTVIADTCTGCELCLPPCPVDCIELLPLAPRDNGIDISGGELAHACIRCGKCTPVCPVHLEPQRLYVFAKAGEIQKAQEINLADCIECRRCERVCPSAIPLVNYYRQAKSKYRAAVHERVRSQLSLQRFEKREERLARTRLQRETHLLKKRERLAGTVDNEKRREEIAAAVARSRGRKPSRHDTPGQN